MRLLPTLYYKKQEIPTKILLELNGRKQLITVLRASISNQKPFEEVLAATYRHSYNIAKDILM